MLRLDFELGDDILIIVFSTDVIIIYFNLFYQSSIYQLRVSSLVNLFILDITLHWQGLSFDDDRLMWVILGSNLPIAFWNVMSIGYNNLIYVIQVDLSLLIHLYIEDTINLVNMDGVDYEYNHIVDKDFGLDM